MTLDDHLLALLHIDKDTKTLKREMDVIRTRLNHLKDNEHAHRTHVIKLLQDRSETSAKLSANNQCITATLVTKKIKPNAKHVKTVSNAISKLDMSEDIARTIINSLELQKLLTDPVSTISCKLCISTLPAS